MVIWRRESIILAIDRHPAILPKMILTSQGDEMDRREARQLLEDSEVETPEVIF
jgi:hypothetical protein